MEVRLISASPLLVSYLAARRCKTSDKNFDKLLNTEYIPAERVERLVDKCHEMGHDGILEHTFMTFDVRGVSRYLTHQLVRHRLMSFCQVSQRHVPQEEQWVTPMSIVDDQRVIGTYENLMQATYDFYKFMIKSGVPLEDARYLLPGGFVTSIAFTVNLRELMHFFELRLAEEAQWEIRDLATAMYQICHEKYPTLFPIETEEPAVDENGTPNYNAL